MDKNGGGQVLFDEFCEWSFQKSLDLDDDDNFEDQGLINQEQPQPIPIQQ